MGYGAETRFVFAQMNILEGWLSLFFHRFRQVIEKPALCAALH
jgi:hypothetical protein